MCNRPRSNRWLRGTMIVEKRKTRRQRLHHVAKILTGPRQFHDCKLSNVSETGARIEVADSSVLPDRFLLLLAARGRARRACQVIWREPQHVGVKFVRRPERPAAKPAAPSRSDAAGATASDLPQ